MEGTRAPRAMRAGRIAVAALTLGLVAVLIALPADRPSAAAADVCLGSTSPAALTTMFDSEPGGIIGADYQRAVPLPDGRTLWLFQDAAIRLPAPDLPPDPAPEPPPDVPPDPPPPTEQLVHNIGMIQTGSCFTVLRSGTDDDPRSWLLAGQTDPYAHWFWPLGSAMGTDGRLYIYLAEMFERGGLYLSAAEPTRTRIVGIDLATMNVSFTGVPPDSSAQLYGFSATTDGTWTYLYGHCHRQFGWDLGPFGVPAHDLGCSGNVPVARVPAGQLFDAPAYWDGTNWQSDPSRAVSVMPTGRTISPSQVRWVDGGFLAVTKVGDWFGSTIHLDRSSSGQGPWSNYARIPAQQRCDSNTCNSYFASWIPGTATTSELVVGLSHNRWDGRASAAYRPTYVTAPAPGRHAFAVRCSIVDC